MVDKFAKDAWWHGTNVFMGPAKRGTWTVSALWYGEWPKYDTVKRWRRTGLTFEGALEAYKEAWEWVREHSEPTS